MKNFIFTLCLSCLFFALATPTFAQPTADKVTCGKTAFFVKTFPTRLCYSGEVYPTREAAQARHQAKMFAMVSCIVNCPDGYSCEPKLIGFTSGGEVRKDGDNYYAGPYVRFKWKCTDCMDIPDTVRTEEVPPVEEEELPPADGEGLEDGGLSFDRSAPLGQYTEEVEVRVESVYPNPATGIVNMEVMLAEEQNTIVFSITNTAGKTVYRKNYNDIPQSIFITAADLSGQADGLYLLSTEVNGKVIGSNKILLQK